MSENIEAIRSIFAEHGDLNGEGLDFSMSVDSIEDLPQTIFEQIKGKFGVPGKGRAQVNESGCRVMYLGKKDLLINATFLQNPDRVLVQIEED